MSKAEMFYRLINECSYLTNAEFRILSILIQYSNDNITKISYRRIQTHFDVCLQTIVSSINKLIEHNLIIRSNKDKQKGQYIIFPEKSVLMVRTDENINCSNDMNRSVLTTGTVIEIEQNNNREREILKNWKVPDEQIKQILNNFETDHVKICIDETINKAKYSRKDYFLRLLQNQDKNISRSKIVPLKTENNAMLKHPASYSNALDNINEIKKINEPKLSKNDIIENLLREGKSDEAQTLKQIWRK